MRSTGGPSPSQYRPKDRRWRSSTGPRTCSSLGAMAYNIADLIEHTIDLVPDRTAIVCGGKRDTYAQLEERANRLAHHLAAHGVGRGSTVGIYSLNSIEFVETMLAAYKLRAVPININYRYMPDELRYIFDNADLAALVHQRQFAPLVAQVRADCPL